MLRKIYRSDKFRTTNVYLMVTFGETKIGITLGDQIDPGGVLKAGMDLAPAGCIWNRGHKSTLLKCDKNILLFWNPVVRPVLVVQQI